MANKHADIVIVGVGAAGAILARELTEAGFTVLGIDKGPYYHSVDFWTKFDELRYSTRAGLSPTMDTDPMTWRPDAQTPAQVLPWAVGLRQRAGGRQGSRAGRRLPSGVGTFRRPASGGGF